MERNHSPNSHTKTWRTNSLGTSALMGVISDIHRVRINLNDPGNVRNEPQQGTHRQAITSSNFQMWIWEVILFYSSKKSPVPTPTLGVRQDPWNMGYKIIFLWRCPNKQTKGNSKFKESYEWENNGLPMPTPGYEAKSLKKWDTHYHSMKMSMQTNIF